MRVFVRPLFMVWDTNAAAAGQRTDPDSRPCISQHAQQGHAEGRRSCPRSAWSLRHRRTPTPVAEPLAPANAPSAAAGEPPLAGRGSVELVRSMGGRSGSRRRAALQPPRHRHASGQCARVRRSTSGGGSLTHPPSRQRSRLQHAPRCAPADARSAGRGSGLTALPQPSQCRPETGLANISKSGRDGQRGAAAQHTHYGAVHRDAGQPRAMPAWSAPPGASSARSRAPHSLPDRGFSARTRAN